MAAHNPRSHAHIHRKKAVIDFDPVQADSIPLPSPSMQQRSPYLPNGGPRLDDFVYPPSRVVLERAPTNYPFDSTGAATAVSSGPASATADPAGSSSATSTCIDANGKNHCHYSNNSVTVPVTLAIVIPIVAAMVVFFILHRRNQRRLRAEDATDKHGSLDFGLGEVHRPHKKGKKGAMDPLSIQVMSEKELRQGKGMSLDLVSPYLPAEIHSTRSSNSLSRSAYDAEDPFRTVHEMTAPSRTPSKVDHQSLYTMSSHHSDFGRNQLHIPGQASPASATAPPLPESPFLDSPSGTARKALPDSFNGERDIPQIHTSSDETPYSPDAQHDEQHDPPSSHTQMPAMPEIHLPEGSTTADHAYPIRNSSHAIIENADSRPVSERTNSREMSNANGLNVPQGNASGNSSRANSAGPFDEWTTYADVLGIVQKESDEAEMAKIQEYENEHNKGLGLPDDGQDTRRLSASIRPLPPDDPNDTAEQRANRIRSFYREYFDGGGDNEYEDDGADYYEDYSQEYLNGATIWDPETGQFIVGNAPYADPITRRAMTPPPRGPPRFRHDGSRPGSRPRAGSAQFRRPHGQRTFSTTSGRPGAAGMRTKPRGRPLPPPSPLRTLPTPYLLGDDSSAFNPIDYAPATTVRDHRLGKTDSPFLEPRPYSPSVRAYSPLVSSFNTLSDMPSPHALRKSSTFTALDFAAPPRFKDVDTGSDAASIRSGKSNMSAVQLANIRAGAYRLSRLPKDVVGTKDDLAASLRPRMDLGR